MKKIIFLLLLNANCYAQTLIPSSGAIEMSLIATVMYNLGEITSPEIAASYSISFLNGKSHLTDKTAPFSISDWYGYGAPGATEMKNGTIGLSPCYFIDGAYQWGVWWSGAGAIPLIGDTIYTDAAKVNPFINHAGSYKITPAGNEVFYVITIDSSGVVTAYQGSCVP